MDYTSIFGELTQSVQARIDAASRHGKQIFDHAIYPQYLTWDTPSVGLNFEELIGKYNITGETEVKGATLFEVIYRQVQACRAYASWQQNHPSGVAAVVLHAFREEYFLQIFDEKKSAPMWLSREELLRTLAAYPYPLFVAGTDKEFAPLTNLLDGKYTLSPYDVCRVQAKTLARLAQEKKWTKSALEPLYLKPARFELEGVK